MPFRNGDTLVAGRGQCVYRAIPGPSEVRPLAERRTRTKRRRRTKENRGQHTTGMPRRAPAGVGFGSPWPGKPHETRVRRPGRSPFAPFANVVRGGDHPGVARGTFSGVETSGVGRRSLLPARRRPRQNRPEPPAAGRPENTAVARPGAGRKACLRSRESIADLKTEPGPPALLGRFPPSALRLSAS